MPSHSSCWKRLLEDTKQNVTRVGIRSAASSRSANQNKLQRRRNSSSASPPDLPAARWQDQDFQRAPCCEEPSWMHIGRRMPASSPPFASVKLSSPPPASTCTPAAARVRLDMMIAVWHERPRRRSYQPPRYLLLWSDSSPSAAPMTTPLPPTVAATGRRRSVRGPGQELTSRTSSARHQVEMGACNPGRLLGSDTEIGNCRLFG